MNIGEKIRSVRTKKGLKQLDLAKRMDVTPAMISQYENGTRNPKYDTCQKIAEALGISWTELILEGEDIKDGEGFYIDKNSGEIFRTTRVEEMKESFTDEDMDHRADQEKRIASFLSWLSEHGVVYVLDEYKGKRGIFFNIDDSGYKYFIKDEDIHDRLCDISDKCYKLAEEEIKEHLKYFVKDDEEEED